MALNGTMPGMITPSFGRDAKEERDELKLLYPEYTPGKRQIIPDEDAEAYLYAQAAAAHWNGQFELFQNRIRFHLGDAEFGTDASGRVIASRRIGPRKGYNVDPGTSDSICKETG
jgi:hypothetical protein